MNDSNARHSTAGDREDWRDLATCRHHDPELFFPVGTAGPALDQIERARRVCHRCLVRTACLSWALHHGMASGIWGGTTEDERRAMRRAPAGR